jgi:hypothetical protein
MLEELDSIKENKIWSLVDLPSGHWPIGVNCIFKVMCDEHGEIVKHKARRVAKGYVQKQGIDFEELFAFVARMESVRVMIFLAIIYNWIVHHMYVKFTFLNGDLSEDIYVYQPLSFIQRGFEGNVLNLHKALYGPR